MKVRCSVICFAIAFVASRAFGADGLLVVQSSYSPTETMNRMETILRREGMTIFARIDHAAGAASVGATLRPTELLIFGNPRGGTPFMQCSQTVGIDLPLKALVWEDEAGTVWLGYNDPAYIAARHEVAECPSAINIGKALDAFVKEALAR